MKPRILFVDDERNVLDGLRRMLRSHRREWDMHFAEGGEEALAQADGAPFDIVVSDMRMPGIDGAQVLCGFAERQPASVRIVLSGEADREAVYRTIGPSHKFLAKPCDADLLTSAVGAVLQTRTDVSETAAALMPGLPCLPSPQSVIDKLRYTLSQDTPSLDQLAEIVADDLSLSAKILQLSNSAYFGIDNVMFVPGQAVRMLGVDVMRDLLELPGFCRPLDEAAPWAADFLGCWRRACRAAAIAECVAGEMDLNDTQKLLARQACKFTEFGYAASLACDGPVDTDMAPAARFMASLWGFPPALVDLLADGVDAAGGDHLAILIETVRALVNVPDDPSDTTRATETASLIDSVRSTLRQREVRL